MRGATGTMIQEAFGGAGHRARLRDLALAVAATGLLTLSAKVQVPFHPVPMTMQTLVVLVIGAAFGWRLGAATILLYLAEGAAGLPVFTGTPAKGLGLPYMLGPTGGYLIGFLAGAALAGFLAERGLTRSLPGALATMLAGSAVILALGFGWLAQFVGVEKAYALGVAPFIAGDLLKAGLGAALLPAAWWAIDRLRRA